MQMTTGKEIEDAIYIEEGVDLIDFENNINKAFMHLSESRDIKHIEFKTGIQTMPTGLPKNWYSMAIHHKPKSETIISDILTRLLKAELTAKEFKVDLAKLRKSVEVKTNVKKVE